MRFFAHISICFIATAVATVGNAQEVSTSSTFGVNGLTEVETVPPSVGSTEATTTVIEKNAGSPSAGIDSTTVETQITAPLPPSNYDMPDWEKALQPNTTSTTTIHDIDTYGRHKEVRSIQKQVTSPSTSKVPAWEQALEPSSTLINVINEQEIPTGDGDEITSVQSQTIGPVPAWDYMPQPDTHTGIAKTNSGDVVQDEMDSPAE